MILTDQIPDRIAQLERDGRGYPVPFIVLRDNDGKPQFAANDIRRVWQAIRESLCHICGQALDANPWFVGGPGSALLNDNRAVYADGPMHHECMQFAMRVCPHLAQLMARAIAPTVQKKLRGQGMFIHDNTTIPGTPSIFVAVQAWQFNIVGSSLRIPEFRVSKPFRKTEYWQSGELMPLQEGRKAAQRAARDLKRKLETDNANHD